MAPSKVPAVWAALALASLAHAQQVFDCTLTLPTNPLTAAGLATPFKLSGCDQRQFAAQGCFAEAAILDTTNGNLSIYHPLVVNNGDVAGTDFITPTPVTLPANSVVAIWFGSNGNSLTLAGDTNGCVDGNGGSVFGQVAYCNAPAMFTAAQKAVSAGQITIPPPGQATKATGQACIAGTRDFRMIDMDQSDNVVTTYLLINGQKLAQNTPANAAANKGAEELSNGSDNALLNDFLQPTMGCDSLSVPSLTAPTGSTKALLLNELLSAEHPPATPALVPENDPMVVNNGQPDLTKINLYRAGVGQTPAASLADANGTTYCQNYAQSGIFIQQNAQLFSGGTTPDAATANNLFTFMANRFATSFGPVPALGCQTIFGLADSPVAQASNGAGVVTSASINTAILSSIMNGQIKAGAATAAAATTTTSAAKNGGGGNGGKAVASSTTAAAATTTSAAAAATSKGSGKGGFGGGRFGNGGGSAKAAASSTLTTTTTSAAAAAATVTTAGTGASTTGGRFRGSRPSAVAAAASSASAGAGAASSSTTTTSAAAAAAATTKASAAAGNGGGAKGFPPGRPGGRGGRAKKARCLTA
jgi:hypothetical protein